MHKISFMTIKPAPRYPFGMFRVVLAENGSPKKTKDGNLAVHSPKEAYEILKNEARVWEKLHGVRAEIPEYKELVQTFMDEQESSLTELFGHLAKFRASLKQAYRVHGYDKVKHILDSGQEILDEISKDDREKDQAMADASVRIVNALFELHIETGMDFTEKCPDENTKRLYTNRVREYRLGSNKVATPVTGYYVLKGERWDGRGNPPAEFIKWKKRTGAEDFSELLVR